MKKAGSLLTILLLCVIAICYAQSLENEITATYNGISEEGFYEFIDLDDEVYLFDEINDEVEIDLDKKEFIGKEFIVKWEEIEEEIYDEDDEPTGEFIIIKTIIYLEEM